MKELKIIVISAIFFFCFFNVLRAEEWMVFPSIFAKTENNKLLSNLFLVYKINVKSDYFGTYKYSYEYDSTHKLLKELRQNLNNEQWLDSIQIFNSYDSTGSLQSVVKRKFENDVWDNVNKIEYTYDTLLNQKIRIYKEWVNDKWMDVYRHIYLFNINGNSINEVYQICENEKWVNENQYINTYNQFNKLHSDLSQFWEDDKWNNSYRNSYLYDSIGNLTEEYLYYWINESSNWDYSSSKLYTYDSNNYLINITSYVWTDNMFNFPSWKRIFEYDEDGIKQTEFYEYFTYDLKWEKYSQLSYNYDSYNRLISVYSYNWNDSQWVSGDNSLYFDDYLNKSYWFSANLLEIYWTSVTEVQDVNYDKKLDIRCSPNPFSESTTIHYTLDEPAFVSINVYNSYGNKIFCKVAEYQDIGEQQFVLDGGNYPSGLYFYTIQFGDRIESGKMALIK